MELITYCCMSCQDRCSHVFIYPVTPALVYSQNPLGITNLAGRDFGFFYCLCSFDSCTLATQGSPTAYARLITSCAGVNAAIYIRAVLGNSFKRSAFVSQHRNKLCRWRHLLPLSAVLMRAYAVDGHWAESVHLRMYTNFKPKSPPDKLTQFQRIVLTIH